MANYPASLPSFTGQVGGSTDPLSSPSHPTAHTSANDEIVAIAAELGLTPSDGWTTVRERLRSVHTPAYKSGLYYAFPIYANAGSGIPSEGEMQAVPFTADGRTTFDRQAVEVTVVGTTGAVVRIGRYADDGTGYPGALISDDGTIDGTTAIGIKEVIYGSAWTPAAGLYWLVAVVQGAAATRPTLSRAQNTLYPLVGRTNLTGTLLQRVGYSQAAVSGALPANFTATVTSGSVGIAHLLRVQ